MTTLTFPQPAVAAVLLDLADAARAAEHTPKACNSICTAVANLIAAAGPHGGSKQAALMDAARGAGFAAEYYAGNGLRVSWQTGDAQA